MGYELLHSHTRKMLKPQFSETASQKGHAPCINLFSYSEVSECAKTGREPAAQGTEVTREQLLQPQGLLELRPCKWTHIHKEKGREHPKILQLATAGACTAFEGGWAVGKRSSRVFTSGAASIGRAPLSSAMTDGPPQAHRTHGNHARVAQGR